MSAWVPGCSGRYRVLPPLPDTLRCGTPLRACRASLHLELAQLLAPQRVEQQRGQDGAVALALDRVGLRRRQQLARLMIAERRRLAFAAFRLRPLDAFDRIVGDGVLLAEIFEQRGQRREPVPDRAAAKARARSARSSRQAMTCARVTVRNSSGRAMPVKRMKSRDRVLIGPARVRVGEIGEPLDLGRHVGQPLELGGGQQPVGGSDFGWELVGGVGVVMAPLSYS